jgi:hypothetical protein
LRYKLVLLADEVDGRLALHLRQAQLDLMELSDTTEAPWSDRDLHAEHNDHLALVMKSRDPRAGQEEKSPCPACAAEFDGAEELSEHFQSSHPEPRSDEMLLIEPYDHSVAVDEAAERCASRVPQLYAMLLCLETGENPEVSKDLENPPNMFRQERNRWRLVFEGRETRLRSCKGLSYIALLLGRSGDAISAIDLYQIVAGVPEAESEAGVPENLGVREEVAASEVDREVRRRRVAVMNSGLEEIREEIEKAEARGDAAAAAEARHKHDSVRAELSRGYGKGGRERDSFSLSEKARKSVSWCISAAIDKIREEHANLADHLQESIEKGRKICYDPRPLIVWDL